VDAYLSARRLDLNSESANQCRVNRHETQFGRLRCRANYRQSLRRSLTLPKPRNVGFALLANGKRKEANNADFAHNLFFGKKRNHECDESHESKTKRVKQDGAEDTEIKQDMDFSHCDSASITDPISSER
jgi:hypothetical protein